MSDSTTIVLQDGLVRYIIPLIEREIFDTLLKSKKLYLFCRDGKFLVGIKHDFSLVAVRDSYVNNDHYLIVVADAATKEEFLKNAETAWLEQHGKER